MGKRQTYIVNGQVFKTKKELEARIRDDIVNKYKNREYLNNEDFTFILDLLKNHPYYQTKIGCGVVAMYINQNPVYRQTRTFYIIRRDKTETDFSWTECLKQTSKIQKVKRALRALVEPHILEFKDNFFQVCGGVSICEITGEAISFTNSHVDHQAPDKFESLFERFIHEYNINIDQLELKDEQTDNKYQDEIADKSLALSWINYHNTHANLRVISPLANLSHVKTNPH